MSFIVCFSGICQPRETAWRTLRRHSTIHNIRRIWWELFGHSAPLNMTAWVEVPPMKKHGLTEGLLFYCNYCNALSSIAADCLTETGCRSQQMCHEM